MKRMIVLLAVLALTLALFAGCGRTGVVDDGSNVSTTGNGVVNGVNPDVPDAAVPGNGMDEGAASGARTGSDAV